MSGKKNAASQGKSAQREDEATQQPSESNQRDAAVGRPKKRKAAAGRRAVSDSDAASDDVNVVLHNGMVL
jgi:hypothetical protein